ncbi:MAG: Fe-S cluster assembly protein SufD [Acidobacteria bacterium]|nr:Fe-S cluster assembly protein SufD [Acidobacteriota bacterium]
MPETIAAVSPAGLAPEAEVYTRAFARVAVERTDHEPSRIGTLRKAAIDRFGELGFPNRKLEEWRSTDVRAIATTTFSFEPSAELVSEADCARFRYDNTHELVFVNGAFRSDLSRLQELPDGVIISSLEQGWREHPELIEPHLGRHAKFDNHAFVALNTALHENGVFVFFPRNAVVETPIHILHLGRGGDSPVASFPRNLFVAEENSQGRIIEQFATAGDTDTGGNHFTCPVTEVVLAQNAVVDHYKLQRESTDAFHMATFQIYLGRSSNFSSHSISWGGGLVRNDVNAVLGGEGCEATLNGLYMVGGTQLVDNHMRVDHVAPHCDSHELFKGVLEGHARAVFNGRIFVHKGAQKTDAKQTNRNLLLSPTALVHSNPQLEIFADDVRCTHGSTVGRLDELGIFYLRSRGIGEEAARSLLTYAFCADIVQRIKDKSVRRDLEEFLFRRLPQGDVVRQAV